MGDLRMLDEIRNERASKSVLAILFIAFLSLVISNYLRITFKDAFFPYYDPYLTKIIASDLTSDTVFNYVSEPLFYYVIKMIHDISFVSFYDIIKYGNLFFIAFFFLVLYIFMSISTFSERLSEKIFVIVGVSYYFLCKYSYLRFSMTLRENLIIIIGFVILMIMVRTEKHKTFPQRVAILVAILLAFVIASHLIVSTVVLGTLIIYEIYCIATKRREFAKNLLISIIIGLLVSSPFIYIQSFGIISQLVSGIQFIQEQGFDISYNWIRIHHFNIPVDIILIIIGTASFILCYFKYQPKIKNENNAVIIIIYFIAVGIGIVISYIPQFGLKPNRFLLYAYIVLSFLLIYTLKWLFKYRHTKIFIPILVGAVLATSITNVAQYQGYFPLNEKNITYIESKLPDLDSYGKIYVGGCAGLIFRYLDAKIELISFKDNLNQIPDKLDAPVVMTSDDIASYRARAQDAFQRFEYLKNTNYSVYDPNSKVWIIFPTDN